MKTLRCLILFAMFHGGVALATPSGDETGITDNRILIGQSAVFSGPSASLGIQFSSGAMAYFNMINAQAASMAGNWRSLPLTISTNRR